MRAALVYDFDGTLARGNMQDVALLPQLGVKTKAQIDKFWAEVVKQNTADDGDHTLAYLRHLVEAARSLGNPITRKLLQACGKKLSYFDGVPDWFDRIDAFGKSVGLEIEHYVVSAGNREIIEGSPLYKKFANVFGCKYHYDKKGEAVWPSVVVNYTTKTQFLFRINKGIENHWDYKAVNEWMPGEDRPIPFSRMIFIGDGDTDVPSFKMMMVQGGTSIAVFDPAEWADKGHNKTHDLIAEQRVHFVAPADYTETSQLDIVVRGVLDRIARAERVHPAYFNKGRFGTGNGESAMSLVDLPSVRGKLLRNEELAPFTWFRVGGAAEVLFLPADADDLASLPCRLAGRCAAHRAGFRLQYDRARWRRAGCCRAARRQGVCADRG